MTLPIHRTDARADQLTAVIAAYPLCSGQLLRAMALVSPSVPGQDRASHAGA